MSKKISTLISAFFILFSFSSLPAKSKPAEVLQLFEDLQQVIISISKSIQPAVVHIEVVHKINDLKYKSLASGLIIDDKGYILTNEHVVDKAISVLVTLSSKLEYQAHVIGTDKQTDLALLKIEPKEKLKVAQMGNSDKVEVGEWVIAVGNPYGFDRTVSFGIVSGKGRVLPNLPIETPLINDFIQTDAAIDPGSSGGPLVNLKGEVIGINSIGFGRAQGFTIPINMAKEVTDKLLASGKINRGWLGVVLQPLNREYASYYNSPDLQGVIISDVLPNSPASKAELAAGDIILEYNKQKVAAEKGEDLNRFSLMVSQTPLGREVPVKILRDNQVKEVKVNITEQPKVDAEEYETGLGFTVKEITENMFRQRMLDDKEGVLVSFVDVAGPASQGELDEGDIIIKVDALPIKTLDDFKKAVSTVKEKKHIMLVVKRGKAQRFILIAPEVKTEKAEKTSE